MGVSILMTPKGRRKEINITPGWRSMAWRLLLDVSDYLDASDIPRLEGLRDQQLKDEQTPPFDWSQDIADMFDTIIAAIRKHGAVSIRGEY